ncbi:hypothetical protein CBL_08586 [Carabus blaptoides fortunei]
MVKKNKTTVIPEYEQHEGPIDAIFDDCETATDIFLKLFACGTITSNRKGFPKNMKEDKKLNRGDYDYRVSNTDVSVYKWKDNTIVYFASNFHGSEEAIVKRTQKDGSRANVKCPLVVKDYNANMGGVDKADQIRGTYGMNRRSRKWIYINERMQGSSQKKSTPLKPIAKRRRYNYSVSDEIRLGNRGVITE